MTTPRNDRASGINKIGSPQAEEERLNEAVVETIEQAGDKDESEVGTDLRSAMLARGLEPDDTSAMATNIVDAVSEPS